MIFGSEFGGCKFAADGIGKRLGLARYYRWMEMVRCAD
jgi:hypothetical protein